MTTNPDLSQPPIKKFNRYLLRSVLLVTIVLTLLALVELGLPAYEKGRLLTSRRFLVIAGPGILVIGLEIALLAVSWTPLWGKALRLFRKTLHWLARWGRANLVIYALLLATYGLLVFGPYGWLGRGLATRSLLLWIVSLAGCVLLKAWSLATTQPQAQPLPKRWIEWLGISVLAAVFGYKIASFIPAITTYPFTLGWSETSRYYYASLFFSERIYGFAVPATVLHPSRYLMQAVPFLVPGTPLWLHRAWQVFLWLALPLLTSLALVKRLKVGSALWRWLAVMWSFLFLLLGPVYYHLLVPVLLVLWGFRLQPGQPGRALSRMQPFISFAVLLLASAWAGISRINWFPVPGILAAVLILLEWPVEQRVQTGQATAEQTPTNGQPWAWKPAIAYSLRLAILMAAATLTAFIAQASYIVWSGNPAESFTSSFSSGLLWYRLLPNPTFVPGILLGTLLASLPLFLLAASILLPLSAWKRIHPLRWLGLSLALLVLFVGGLIVSVKIGGGSNLHNMDAYLMLLWVIALSFFFAGSDLQSINPERAPIPATPTGQPAARRSDRPAAGAVLRRGGLITALVIVTWFTITTAAPPLPLPDREQVEKGLYNIKRFTQDVSQQQGEVLFLSNRHLLTFGEIEGVRLAPEYERVFLMEMAMAGEQEQLEAFHNDLKNQRFALIISEPLYDQQKDESAIFGEENNAWVSQVSQVVLCYYEEVKLARYVHLQLLVPRSSVQDCSD